MVVKLLHAYFPTRKLLLVATETVLIFSAMIAAVFLRFGPDAELTLNYQEGFLKVAFVCVVCILAMYYFDLYDSLVLNNPSEVKARLIEVLGVICLILSTFYYLYPPAQLGRGIFVVGIIFIGACLAVSREFFFVLNRSSWFAHRAVLLGGGPLAKSLAAEVKKRPELGIRLVGYIDLALGADSGGNLNGLKNLGTLDDLLELVDRERVQRIIVAIKDRRNSMPVRELLDLRLKGMQVEDGGRVLERISGKIEVDQLNPSWLIFADGFRLKPGILALQRLVGIVVSILLLLIVLPVIPLVVILIKATSPGPVLYKQKRIGKDGVVFNCYKFRTMRNDAEADTGPTWASDSDPRITSVGRFLRIVRLDEIPQLWNVLRGDMNFVGPRPERPEFDRWLKSEIPYYHLRQIVRPGITGWAQISCSYGASVEQAKEKMRYDLYYIKNISFSLDLLVIFETIKTVLFGRGAR